MGHLNGESPDGSNMVTRSQIRPLPAHGTTAIVIINGNIILGNIENKIRDEYPTARHDLGWAIP
jgi:hypothetical protein